MFVNFKVLRLKFVLISSF